ncbi:GDSL-type esterase/lipase family protein [Plantactinospora soyae]|uniref:Lysophospholipase L1-like esterase n=1 Tax=Plantactinospora soyae TaxID=1544732 RepID=A0A927MCT1_9ACTN|nr:GDSL-type esterase/lipase family protein [Plantactinospora soyae]MBE1490761.1 lysophospholipase L1-like esterase [Plantactinospora soyae]
MALPRDGRTWHTPDGNMSRPAARPVDPEEQMRKRSTRPLLAVLTAVVVALGGAVLADGAASAESNGGVRVMPLGDSITDGLTVPGGYRIGLWQKLVAGGHTVDFVGSQFNGPGSLGDHDHEGHSGWRIDQIDANIVNWLRTTTPRTVLLHIGTNDMFGNAANAPARLSALLDRITNTSPGIIVFVATIIPFPAADSAVRTFNAAIPGIVQGKVAAGKRVHLVDMYRALTAADLADGVHPNAGGYEKMSTAWFNALRSVPDSLTNGTPSPTPTTSPTPTPTTSPTGPPPGGNCTASVTPGTVWGDRYNTSLTVSGASSWTVVAAVTAPQQITTTWSGSATLSSNNTVLTMRSNGSGNTFGFTTMTNGNSSARPQIRSCTTG